MKLRVELEGISDEDRAHLARLYATAREEGWDKAEASLTEEQGYLADALAALRSALRSASG